MKIIHGDNIPETKDELISVIPEWNENWVGEEDEIEINNAVLAWATNNTHETVAEMLKHPRVTMVGGYASRMGIVKYLKHGIKAI
ncbi:MAG: hypothetical protein WCZ10_10575 [Desulfobulbaceae bacterium]